MDNQVDEIKQKLNIVDVINRYVPLKKRGRHHVACCPFHGEKTPSFTVSEDMQIYKCFGCGKAGDIFNFLEEYEKVDFKEALTELAALAGVTLVKSSLIDHQESKKKLLIEINTQVAKFYNYILLSHPMGKDALDYVKKRGISEETIKTFSIGFSPNESTYLSNFILKKGYKIADLIDTGTFGKSNYGPGLYDRFQGRLVFPLPDYRGHIVAFAGRIVPQKSLPAGRQANMAKYINSPETEIYHKSRMLFGLNLAKEAIRVENSVIIVEGEFDMISPYQSGFKNIVALKGTAFTQDQLQLLRRYTDTIILALDSDFAGNNAARKSIELADSMEFDIKVLNLGDKYKDPDEAIKDDPEFFKSQLLKATDVWDFIIQSQLKSNDINTVKGKKEVLSVVLPFLVKIKSPVTKSDYFKKLANEINSSIESVYEESQKFLLSPVRSFSVGGPKKNEPIEESDSKTEKLEELLLSLIIGAKNPSKLALKLKKYLDQLTVPRFKTIANFILEKEDLSLKEIMDSLPAEIQPLFQEIYFESEKNQIDSKTRLEEIKKATSKISSILLKDRLNQLSNQISKLESEENEEALKEVELEYKQVLEKLHQLQTNK